MLAVPQREQPWSEPWGKRWEMELTLSHAWQTLVGWERQRAEYEKSLSRVPVKRAKALEPFISPVKFQSCYVPTVWPWWSHLTFKMHSLPIITMGMMWLTQEVITGNNKNNLCQVLVPGMVSRVHTTTQMSTMLMIIILIQTLPFANCVSLCEEFCVPFSSTGK